MFNKKIRKLNKVIDSSLSSGEYNKGENGDKEIDSLMEMANKVAKAKMPVPEDERGFKQRLENELWHKMQAAENESKEKAENRASTPMLWRRYAYAGSIISILLAVGLGVFVVQKRQEIADQQTLPGMARRVLETTRQIGPGLIIPETAQATLFASWQEEEVKVEPNVKPYTVKADLDNVVNQDRFYLNDNTKKLLIKNAFVVQPGSYQEFYSLYENNRYQKIPNFITTDSVLHNYHLYFDYLLRSTEEEKLIPALNDLTDLMISESQAQYDSLAGTSWENAAKRNLAFFVLAKKLLQSDYVVPEMVAGEVEKELALIDAHAGIDVSPIMTIGVANVNPGTALKEDYSQYIARGHYTRSEGLTKYFKAMMWYGRITFRLRSDGETRSAILMTKALSENETAGSLWQNIYEPTNFFVGRSDDLNFYHYRSVLLAAFEEDLSLDSLSKNHEAFTAFLEATKELDPPNVNSIPIFDPTINPDREKEIKGFRLMGQRYTVDSDIHQRLVFREVGAKEDSGPRMLPKGLDIPAALGSERAAAILREEGDYDYENYPENMQKLRDYMSTIADSIWHQNLYWGWLSVLKTLLPQAPQGYPSFMTNQAWQDKSLNTYLGSWTELRHDTILYVKQVYAEMGGGGPQEYDDRGYVEPNPYLYAKLAALTKMTRDGLESRNLLSDKNKENLSRLEELILTLKKISEKELNGQELSDDDYEFIRSYGGNLEHFWLETFSEEEREHGRKALLMGNPAALVADVATDPNGQVLEEAIGNIFVIYVVVPLGDELRLAKGGIFSHYEFAWPLDDRLTNEAWREMIQKRDVPDLPAWTGSYMTGQY